MSLLLELRRNVNDVRKFGPQSLLRHVSRLSGGKVERLSMPGVGSVFVRRGESDLDTFRQVFAYGEYDLGVAGVSERLKRRYDAILRDGKIPVIVDAGANVGAASLWYRQRYPRATVIAVEPEPGNAAMLRRNVQGRDRIIVMEAAIGPEAGFATVINEGQGWAARTERAESGTSMVTVDDACAQVEGGELFIAKIDIEGFEKDLFSSNLGWIDRAAMVIIEPHDWMLPGQQSSATFQRAMGSRDFELFISGENLIYVRV